MKVTDQEYRHAINTIAKKTVEDVGVNIFEFCHDEWYNRQVDRIVDYLLSDTFQDEIADQIVEYNEINERIRAREEEGDQALELRREP